MKEWLREQYFWDLAMAALMVILPLICAVLAALVTTVALFHGWQPWR